MFACAHLNSESVRDLCPGLFALRRQACYIARSDPVSYRCFQEMAERWTAKYWKSGTPWPVRVAAFFLLAMTTLTQMSDVASARSWVKVWNNIGPDQRVFVACYSGDGHSRPPRTLNFDEVYYFKFLSVARFTRWWCFFEWENTRQNQTLAVYDHTDHNFMPVDCHQCLWAARPDGWYVWNKQTNHFKWWVPWTGP